MAAVASGVGGRLGRALDRADGGAADVGWTSASMSASSLSLVRFFLPASPDPICPCLLPPLLYPRAPLAAPFAFSHPLTGFFSSYTPRSLLQWLSLTAAILLLLYPSRCITPSFLISCLRALTQAWSPTLPARQKTFSAGTQSSTQEIKVHRSLWIFLSGISSYTRMCRSLRC